MTLLSELVTEVQRRALSGLREEQNQLGSAVNASASTVSLAAGQTLGSIQAGAVLQVDYELMLVEGAAATTGINVVRGYYGSTAASHATGALMTVNPRFTAVDIIKAVNETIDDLSSPSNGLYQMLEITLTYNPVLVGYDFTDVNTGVALTPANLIDVHEVRVHDYGPAQAWPLIGPSQYKAPYSTPLVNASDDVLGVTGLHTQAHDIPTLGAAYRMMAWREFKRSFTESQGEPRRAQEVPVGSSETAVKMVAAQLQARIDDERTRLDRMYQRQWR